MSGAREGERAPRASRPLTPPPPSSLLSRSRRRRAPRYAAAAGDEALVALLLELGASASPDVVSAFGWSAAHYALHNKHAGCARLILLRHDATLVEQPRVAEKKEAAWVRFFENGSYDISKAKATGLS